MYVYNYKKVKKNMTYEKIGEEVGISPQQVHKIEKETINKIINTINEEGRFNIFQIVLNMAELFGVEPHQIYGKLNKKNKQLMYQFIQENFGTQHEDLLENEDFLNNFRK